jgi:hypothetical protein
MIDSGNQAIVDYMAKEWGALAARFQSEVWLENSETKEYGPISLT